jgi:sorting nexin-29
MAVKCLNNNRSPGTDGIPAELYKHGGTKLLQYIHSIVTDAWERESLPAEWEEGIICPIYKKGGCLRCGVMLLNTVYKMFSKILSERLRPKIEAILGWYQTGFQEGKSTIDQIHALRQILERMKEQNITAFYLFVDFKSAFDSVIREQLHATMSEMGIPMKLVKLTRAALKRVRSRVKIQDITLETSETKRGLRQGDSLSCCRFNLALEKVIRDAKLDIRGNIYRRTVQILAYADDLVIVGRTIQAMKKSFMVLETSVRKMGLAANEEKTKFIEVGRKITTVAYFTVGNYKFEKVHKFRYLGSLVTDKNDISIEIKNRTGVGNKCYYGLRKHLGS